MQSENWVDRRDTPVSSWWVFCMSVRQLWIESWTRLEASVHQPELAWCDHASWHPRPPAPACWSPSESYRGFQRTFREGSSYDIYPPNQFQPNFIGTMWVSFFLSRCQTVLGKTEILRGPVFQSRWKLNSFPGSVKFFRGVLFWFFTENVKYWKLLCVTAI